MAVRDVGPRREKGERSVPGQGSEPVECRPRRVRRQFLPVAGTKLLVRLGLGMVPLAKAAGRRRRFEPEVPGSGLPSHAARPEPIHEDPEHTVGPAVVKAPDPHRIGARGRGPAGHGPPPPGRGHDGRAPWATAIAPDPLLARSAGPGAARASIRHMPMVGSPPRPTSGRLTPGHRSAVLSASVPLPPATVNRQRKSAGATEPRWEGERWPRRTPAVAPSPAGARRHRRQGRSERRKEASVATSTAGRPDSAREGCQSLGSAFPSGPKCGRLTRAAA